MKKKSKKVKDTIKRMKKTRALDSNSLREIIVAKAKWADAEIKKGEDNIKTLQVQIYRLQGIILFIKDLLEEKE